MEIVLAVKGPEAGLASVMNRDDMSPQLRLRLMAFIAFSTPEVYCLQMALKLILILEVRFVITFKANVMQK